MANYLGPIPLSALADTVDGTSRHGRDAGESRLWRAVTFCAGLLIIASMTFIVLAASGRIFGLAQEVYFAALRMFGNFLNLVV